MSRSYSEARAAWQAWYAIYSRGKVTPVGFKHQCDVATNFEDDDFTVHEMPIVCRGCHYEIKNPEVECAPIYGEAAISATAAGVRVLRLLEYVYIDAETAAKDMAGWTHGISIGRIPGTDRMRVTMRSAVLPFQSVEWTDG